jgi:hypothetical protein
MNQKKGVYIVANDRVIEQAIALLNSIRFYDPDIPVVMIPFDDNYQQVAQILKEKHRVTLYKDLDFIKQLSQQLFDIFGENFFDKPNKLRKQACWFGEFDEFIYIDTDIVVFEPLSNSFQYFDNYDFICCDYQHKSQLKNIFTPKILEAGVITEADIQDTFNSGFWGSKKSMISEAQLTKIFTECAKNPEYFDFSQKVSDQPIFNYMVLTRIDRRFNIVRRQGGAPGNWGGSTHFERQGDILVDTKINQPLQFIHWAGIKIKPGCPYWDIWKHYRYLDDPKPPADPPPELPPTLVRRALNKVKNKLKIFNG